MKTVLVAALAAASAGPACATQLGVFGDETVIVAPVAKIGYKPRIHEVNIAWDARDEREAWTVILTDRSKLIQARAKFLEINLAELRAALNEGRTKDAQDVLIWCNRSSADVEFCFDLCVEANAILDNGSTGDPDLLREMLNELARKAGVYLPRGVA